MMPPLRPLAAATALLLPGLAATALPAPHAITPHARQQAAPPVTDAGFAELAEEATFYAEVPLVGTFGKDVWADGVSETIRRAADNPHVHHIVLMLDSETREGAMFGEEVVGIRQSDLEVHGLILNATHLAVTPIVFCDALFIVEGAHIGGLDLHNYIPPGSEEVTAKQVGIFTNQLASAAEAHGHDPDIIRSLINKENPLHYWRENGASFAANNPPDDTTSVDDYRHILPLNTDGTVMLDDEQAVMLGLARPIEEFDAEWVGDQIGATNWTLANRYGIVAGQIGYARTAILKFQDRLDQLDRAISEVERNRDNRNNIGLRLQARVKRTLERGVSLAAQIDGQLEELYLNHPERHAYFHGPNGETILEDPEQWERDLAAAQQNINQARSRLNSLASTFEQLDLAPFFSNDPDAYFDPAELDPYIEMLDHVEEHLDGIRTHGNAHYWDSVYEEPLPEDEYGVTYG